MIVKSGRWGGWAGAVGLVVALVSGGMEAAPADAQTPKPMQSRKLTRELAIMEKIIDQMLLDSQNFLVYSQPETRGLYLDEFGILFSFQASLVNRNSVDMNWDVDVDEDGNVIIKDKNRNKNRNSDDDELDEADEERLRKTWEKSQEEREGKLYAQGKAEILDILLDYGDTMTSLRDDQWLGIAAYLKGSDYFLRNKISRLLLKAKASDIRAYAEGRLQRDQMLSRVVEEEY